MSAPKVDDGLAVLLASIVVHAEEHLESLAAGDANAVMHDEQALRSVLDAPAVKEWIKAMGPLAPLKRSARPVARRRHR